MADQDFERLLQEFAAGEPARQHAAFRDLLAQRRHHSAVNDLRFKDGVRALIQAAASTASPHDRLLAVATLGRIASVFKRLRKDVYSEMAGALEVCLPEPHLLEDPDDRTYVGDICGAVRPRWCAEYTARAAVTEEAGEEARLTFLRALLSASPDLTSALKVLMPPLQKWTPTTEAPGESSARRLRRLLAALREAMAEASLEPGIDVGHSLAEVVRAAFAGGPQPSDTKVAAETAEEIAGSVHELVRLRFSLATEARTYDALRIAKAWLPGRSWEKFAERSSRAALVAQDITEAMLILARQAIADDLLAEQLAVAAGSRERARARMVELAKKPGLADNVRSWLVEGRRSGGDGGQQEAGEPVDMDENIRLADLLVDAERFRAADATCRREFFPELEMLQPSFPKQLERVLNFGLGLCDAIEAVGRRKGLRLRGSFGSEEDYAPLEHELVDGSIGARRVRIVRPVVEQVRKDGTPFVIRKGVVESAG